MSGVVEVGTDAMRRHAGEVEALAGAAYDGVLAGRHLAVSGEAFGRLCAFLGAALAPVQEAGVAGTSLAVEQPRRDRRPAAGHGPAHRRGRPARRPGDARGSRAGRVVVSGEALLAGRHDSTVALSGIAPVQVLVGTGRALTDGDWVEAGVLGVATGLEGLGVVADPLGALVAAGVGFVLEHLQPLAGWFDDLAGDPDQIHAFATSWHRIAGLVHDTSDHYLDAVGRATSPWDGLAVGAYRSAARAQAAVIDALGVGVTGVAAATETAGGIVAGVREIVRDALADLVGQVVSKSAQLLSGVMTVSAIADIVATVAAWTRRVSGFVEALLRSISTLSRHLDDLVGRRRGRRPGAGTAGRLLDRHGCLRPGLPRHERRRPVRRRARRPAGLTTARRDVSGTRTRSGRVTGRTASCPCCS